MNPGRTDCEMQEGSRGWADGGLTHASCRSQLRLIIVKRLGLLHSHFLQAAFQDSCRF